MKGKSLRPPLALALLLALAATPAHGFDDNFTYQGHLDDNGAPANGIFDIRFDFFPVASGGASAWTFDGADIPVTNGLFSVEIDPPALNGTDYWIQLSVRPGASGGAYSALAPRQKLMPSPYAYRAQNATNADTAGNAANLGGTAPGGFVRATGGTLSGNLTFSGASALDMGSTTRQMLNLWGGGVTAQYGIGVQSDTLYQRSNNDFSWFKGGTHSDTKNSAGSGGIETMRLGSDSTLWLRPVSSLAPRGRVVFGDLTTSGQPFVSVGEASDDDDVLELYGEKVRVRSNFAGNRPQLDFGASTGQLISLFNNGADSYGIGVQTATQYFRSGDSFAWYRDGSHNDNQFNPGTGGTRLMSLDGSGELHVSGQFAGLSLQNRETPTYVGSPTNGQRWVVYSRNYSDANTPAEGQLAIWSGGDVAAFRPNGDLYLSGAFSTTVLTIRGGADVAEPFQMTAAEKLEEGSVVVIDPSNPGKLKLSDHSYDRCVAGVVSGAGGVQPGLRLQQDGVLEGGQHVALSGRVYVKADASGGAIQPGDLLTTSDHPGHAMKVSDHSSSQGAVLGKAMTPLADGTGLVLVLVTLQ